MMKYQIIIEPEAQSDLINIFNYILENDSENKAKNFLLKLEQAISTLSFMPQRCRQSHYIDDKNVKDLIFNGYTICYTIKKTTVHILTVFRKK